MLFNVHELVVKSYGLLDDTRLNPAGTTYPTVTFSAAYGPLLRTLMMYITVSPVLDNCVSVIPKSANSTFWGIVPFISIATLSVLLSVYVSTWSQLTSTLFVNVPLFSPLAVIIKDMLDPLDKLSITHSPVTVSYPAVADIKVNPVGNTSFTVTLVALLGPLLVTVIM